MFYHYSVGFRLKGVLGILGGICLGGFYFIPAKFGLMIDGSMRFYKQLNKTMNVQ